MSLLFIYANTNYAGDNEQIIPDYKDASVMLGHRLTQISLCRFEIYNENKSPVTNANFLRCGDASIIEADIFVKTLQFAEVIPEAKKTLELKNNLLVNGNKLQMTKKTSYIISSDAKIDNFSVYQIEQKLFDKLGTPFSEIAADVASDINNASIIAGFNIDYHLSVLRYELGLLNITINDIPKICLSCICRELAQNPAITKEEMCAAYGFNTTGFYDSLCNCFACAKLLFTMIENRRLLIE